MRLSKRILLLVVVLSIAVAANATAQERSLFRTLKVGDSGGDVRLLQEILNRDPETRVAESGAGSPGMETEYFGGLTRAAVIRFQKKFRQEVLYPAGVFAPTGVAGPMTRAKLTAISSNFSSATAATTTDQLTAAQTKPRVFSVTPARVRRGDTVTVHGENFALLGNQVELGDGPISAIFSNLASPDGKTITFTYEPPILQTMTEAELRARSPETAAQIEAQLPSELTLSDVMKAGAVRDETRLRESLTSIGRSTDGLYHFFHVIVSNGNGSGTSETALLRGLRHFSSDTAQIDAQSSFFSVVQEKVIGWTRPKVANAQVHGGGYYSLMLVCTCSGALVTLNIGTPFAGPLVWQPGFPAMVGSCRAAGNWVGFAIPGAGICPMYIGYGCVTLVFSQPMWPFGCNT